MLGLQLKLTPAQVRVLLQLCYAVREEYEYRNHKGEKCKALALPLELAADPHFLTTSAALERRSLIRWDNSNDYNKRGPVPTEAGRAMAGLVYQHAKAITDFVEAKMAVSQEVPL